MASLDDSSREPAPDSRADEPGTAAAGASEPTRSGGSTASPKPDPLSVELEEGDSPCPNCGTLLPGPHAVLCPSCGCDLVRLAQRQTVRGRPVQEGSTAAGGTASGRRSQTVSGDGNALLRHRGTAVPLGLAAGAMLTVIGSALAGWSGLFPRRDGLFLDAAGEFVLESPRWISRLELAAKIVVQTGTLALAILGGLLLMALVRRASLGDRASFGARVVAIAAVAQLALLVLLRPPIAERSLELALQALAVFALVLVWFRFTMQEAAQVLGGTLVLYALIQLGAWCVVWAG